ncbi:MAG: helix-turn-helix transcriptional regulator [Eubacteriales bacterium]|nr:helix-turn-helix transcriptional regulator [Eubacteriales bacterium]
MTYQNKFKDNLKILRQERKIGQIELAKIIGVSKGIISLWENGLREPNLYSLIMLSKFFNVSIDELVGLNQIN